MVSCKLDVVPNRRGKTFVQVAFLKFYYMMFRSVQILYLVYN